MNAAKSTACLTWSDATYSLVEFLEKFGVPNLVCIKEGHYGINDTCTFENDQVLMLHALRRKHHVIGEDAIGRHIAIPLQCKTKLLRCHLSIYCKCDTLYVSQIARVHPYTKYVRVLENHWDNGIEYLQPDSILEIETIDSRNSAVKFKDINKALPFECNMLFEPLLDSCEYTLESVVGLSGLPAKVLFLQNPKSNQEIHNEFENLASNLGKITLTHSEGPQMVVVATKIDDDSLRLAEISIRCLQIPKDFNVNVSLATELVKNDPAYLNIIRELNQAFLHRYNLKDLDNLDKCQYLDRRNGSAWGVVSSVLVGKVQEENNSQNELSPRFCPVVPQKLTPSTARQITLHSHDQQFERPKTVKHQADLCKNTIAKGKNPASQKKANQENYSKYKSNHESSSEDEYKDIDYYEYYDISDHDYHNVSDHEYHSISDHQYHEISDHDDISDHEYHAISDHECHEVSDHEYHEISDHDDISDHEYHAISDHEYHEISDHEYHEISDREYHDTSDHDDIHDSDNEYHAISDYEYHDISDHEYQEISDDEYSEINDRECLNVRDLIKPKHVIVASEVHVIMTSEEDQIYPMSDSVSRDKVNAVEDSNQGAKWRCGKNWNKTTSLENFGSKISLNDPSANFCASNDKSDNDSFGTETAVSKRAGIKI